MKLSEVNALAVYNSEVARGIMHTEEYQKFMLKLQAEYYVDSMKENRNPKRRATIFRDA